MKPPVYAIFIDAKTLSPLVDSTPDDSYSVYMHSTRKRYCGRKMGKSLKQNYYDVYFIEMESVSFKRDSPLIEGGRWILNPRLESYK